MNKKTLISSGPVSKISEEMLTDMHGGHKVRSGGKIVDRSKIGAVSIAIDDEKVPNQFNGHTYKNKKEKYRLDGHKMIYHIERILAWQIGEHIAPIQIDMGLTKFCNMGCIYCIGVTQGGMQKGQMIQPEVLLNFIGDCGRLGVKSVAFIGDGEPTLNPGLYDSIVFAKQVGVDTGMATNGIALDLNRIHDVLRDSTFVRINLSAAEPNSFHRIHQVGSNKFMMLIEKIKEMVRLKKEYHYPCTIGIQMVLIPENFDQIIKLAHLGAKIGVDYLQIKQCSDTEYGELGIDRQDYTKAEDSLREAEKFSNDTYLVSVKWNKINILGDTELYKSGFRKYDICYGTPFLGQISGNGKVYPCGPFFGKERFYIGDIHEQSYYDIVMSNRYWDVQKDIIDNVDVHYDCTVGCRQDYINKFLWDTKNSPEHVNFI